MVEDIAESVEDEPLEDEAEDTTEVVEQPQDSASGERDDLLDTANGDDRATELPDEAGEQGAEGVAGEGADSADDRR